MYSPFLAFSKQVSKSEVQCLSNFLFFCNGYSCHFRKLPNAIHFISVYGRFLYGTLGSCGFGCMADGAKYGYRGTSNIASVMVWSVGVLLVYFLTGSSCPLLLFLQCLKELAHVGCR